MPAYKNQHYVPQSYMRLFSADGVRVGVFVIRSRRLIPHAPISGQACRDYFYGRDPRTEQAFGEIEGHAARILGDAVARRTLPAPGSEDHERLILFLGIQHSRTVRAAEQHSEGAMKAAKAMLRRKAELEGNATILEHLDKVVITRTNAVSEVVRYATVGANLLADLSMVLVENASGLPFISSDAPVALHNQRFEGQRIAVTGYASVGLQLFLPLGPTLALLAYDAAAYDARRDGDGIVRTTHDADVRQINDLQLEVAHAVLLVGPGTPEDELQERARHWETRRRSERVAFREEVVERTGDEVRTRQGGGEAPSAVALDLSFVTPLLPAPAMLGEWEMPPVRDPARVARTDRAFDMMAEWERTVRGDG